MMDKYRALLSTVAPHVRQKCEDLGLICIETAIEFRPADARLTTMVVEDLQHDVCLLWRRVKNRLSLAKDTFAVLSFADVDATGRPRVRSLYVGPPLPNGVADLWAAIGGKNAAMTLQKADAQWAIGWVFELEVMSPLEAAHADTVYHKIRRLRTGGALYGVAQDEIGETSGHQDEGEGELTWHAGKCPLCHHQLMPLIGRRPVAELEDEGCRNISTVREEAQHRARAAPAAA